MQMHIPVSPVRAVGYSLREGSPEFDDLGAGLDEAEALGVDVVELPVYAWHLMVEGRLLENRVKDLQRRPQGGLHRARDARHQPDGHSRAPRPA